MLALAAFSALGPRRARAPPPAPAVLRERHAFFFAALLKDNAPILGAWATELKALIARVAPSPVYVSILENGDSVDGTAAALRRLAADLRAAGVPHTVVTEPLLARQGGEDRVPWLARLRNAALAPLGAAFAPAALATRTPRIVFLNDVVFAAEDLASLISTDEGRFDVACGLDFFFEFYDTWVARDAAGAPLSGNFPYFAGAEDAMRVRTGQPVRARSCWNGAAVMDAAPFLDGRVAFRALPDTSECTVVCEDLAAAGFGRVVINPGVVVAYTRGWWLFHAYAAGFMHPFQYLLGALQLRSPRVRGGGRGGRGASVAVGPPAGGAKKTAAVASI